MDRRRFCFTMLSIPGALSASRLALAQDGSAAYTQGRAVWDHTRRIRFVLSDPLEHPFYFWPRTLLHCPIAFDEPVALDRLQLLHTSSGEPLPLQFSDVVSEHGRIRSATLHFFADLPSGGHHEFVLSEAASPVAIKPLVSARAEGQTEGQTDGQTLVLDNGAIQVRLPASQTLHGEAPGPVLQLARGGSWFGNSRLHFTGDNVVRLTTEPLAQGPLFLRYRLTYETAGGSRYIATVQLNAGMDFVRLSEDMEAIHPGVHGEIVTDWTGLGITHRQSANHPYPTPPKPLPYDDYAWEPLAQPYPPRPGELEGGELPFVVGLFQPWSPYRISTWSNFWNQHSNDALAVFIDRAVEWEDHEYANEISSTALAIRFHTRDGQFHWTAALQRGSRSTCLALYDHARDKEAMHRIEQQAAGVTEAGIRYKTTFTFVSHAQFLQSRYGTLDLDLVKDWVLDYPRSAKRAPVVFQTGDVKDATEVERRILSSNFACALACAGTRQNADFSPVPCRQVERFWVDGYNRLESSLTDRQRRRLTATFLLMAYVTGGEEFMPLVRMVSGHPNFIADVKSVPAGTAFLFPQHAMSSTWADLWEKAMLQTMRYNTRPTVQAWDAVGGRWTENLGTYVWAFLRPALHSEFLAESFDGNKRLLSPQLAELAEWLTHALSAPFRGESKEAWELLALDGGHEWGTVAPGHAPARVHLPLGAHSDERIPPRSMWYLGNLLRNYAPLAAEHAMWAARPASQDMETAPGPNAWDALYTAPDNLGTNPHLVSRKHTGYGIVLRAAVGSDDELSVHLQQIDDGPNYRWGRSAEGGCGAIYFYAAGKAFSFTGSEDVGDRNDQDTDFCSNFGVYKDGFFRTIGMNVLSRPMFDLGVGQFAKIVPRESPQPYATPEYLSRSVLLAGHDYFVLTDRVQHPLVDHRFSWFVRRGSNFPEMHFVRAGDPKSRQTKRSTVETEETRGMWVDGEGDSMVVVTHRKDLTAKATRFGCTVQGSGFDDKIFDSTEPLRTTDVSTRFEGTSGLIRHTAAGTEFALFHGTTIGVGDLTFHLAAADEDNSLGIGGTLQPNLAPRGRFVATQATDVTIELAQAAEGTRFFLDGEAVSASFSGGKLSVHVPRGHHAWEITPGLPVPLAPHVQRTENFAGGAHVFLAPVASAESYILELSHDNGLTWASAASGKPVLELRGLANGTKVHVRGIAKNAQHASEPGPEYPLYVSDQPLPPPDGLRVALAEGAATLTWGEVLGVTEYRVYARALGERAFRILYRGLDRTIIDRRSTIHAAHATPSPLRTPADAVVEYYVTSVNGNGEGPRSRAANADPGSWRNWDPRPGEPFRRVYSFEPGSEPAPGTLPRYYPE